MRGRHLANNCNAQWRTLSAHYRPRAFLRSRAPEKSSAPLNFRTDASPTNGTDAGPMICSARAPPRTPLRKEAREAALLALITGAPRPDLGIGARSKNSVVPADSVVKWGPVARSAARRDGEANSHCPRSRTKQTNSEVSSGKRVRLQCVCYQPCARFNARTSLRLRGPESVHFLGREEEKKK